MDKQILQYVIPPAASPPPPPLIISQCYGVSPFLLLYCVMVLASVMVLTYIWSDDYLHVVICCIFSNNIYHHVGTLQC